MPLSETLELDITTALSGVDAVEAAMTAAAQAFGSAIDAALAPLAAVAIDSIDASAVTTGIDDAVAAADPTVVATADAAEVTADVDAAIAAANGIVSVAGEAGEVTTVIDDAVAAADTTVVVEGDASGLTDAIESAVADADTSGATGGVQELGSAATQAGGGFDSLSGSVGAFSGIARASTGDATGLASGIGGLGPQGAAAAGGIAAVAGVTKIFFDNALEARTATERFNRVFGELAATVEHISFGGLNTSIEELALKIGASDDGLRVAAARVGELGVNSGRTAEESAKVSQEFVAIAARLSVVNPALGTADQIVDSLGGALARGGRFAAGLGISLTQTEIVTRALADTGKSAANELTIFDKQAAGAALTVEKLGNNLGKDINDNANKAEVSIRSFRTAIDETVEAAGGPLIDPIVSAMKEAAPLIEVVAKVLGVTLLVGLKGLELQMKLLGPLFDLLNKGLDLILGAFKSGGAIVTGFKDTISTLIEEFNSIPVLPDISDPFKQNTAAAGDAAKATDEYGKSAETAAEKQGQLNDSLNKFLDAQIAAIGGDLALEKANNDLEAAIATLAEKEKAKNAAIAAGKGDTEAGQKAVKDYEDALRSAKEETIRVAEQTADLANKQAEANGKTLTAKERQDNLTTSLATTASTLAPGSALRTSIEGYILKINNVPADKATKFLADVQQALKDTGHVQTALDGIPRVVNVRVNILEGIQAGANAVANLPKRAHGGPVFSGFPYLVGEQGPELFIPRTSGSIVNATTTQMMMAQGGGSYAAAGDQRPIDVRVYEAVSAEATADAVSARIAAEATR